MDSVLGLVRHSGNDGLFRAIEMSLLATASGQPLHLHAEGLRGTGKTTVMRAVRRLLPRIRRIKGCLYNCDPAFPHCPVHRGLNAAEVEQLGEEWVPMPFLEISHSAKVGTVVGSIDLGRLVSPTHPEAALLPGTIPQAHRGIIFVDEINRLAETAPELADVLLDVMGTKPGRVQIEETGLPAVELPVQVSVWAASNPDEDPGPLEDIRRQLSDRFDFVVYTDRPGEAAVVEEILNLAGGSNWHRPLSPADETRAELFRSEVADRMTALRSVQVPHHLRTHVADLYSRFNVESLRAVQAIQLGMRLAACLEERTEASGEDLARIAPLALRHRLDGETIKKVMAHLSALGAGAEPAPPAQNSRSRFSSVSFGGAAMPTPPPQPVPERESPPRAADRPADAAGAVAPRSFASQYPPRPRAAAPQAQAQPQPQQSSWISKTLAGLRKNLGLAQAQPQARPEGRRDGRISQAAPPPRNASAPPRTGQLYQRAEMAQSPEAKPQGGRSAGGQGQQSQMQMADPLKTPSVAPPNRARPISELDLHELIRTEEELGRR